MPQTIRPRRARVRALEIDTDHARVTIGGVVGSCREHDEIIDLIRSERVVAVIDDPGPRTRG